MLKPRSWKYFFPVTLLFFAFLTIISFAPLKPAIPAMAQQALVDTDKDGLPDEWETKGFMLTEGDFVDLSAMGADPRHKDLFLQIDYMADDKHSHKPKAEALKIVIDAFARAPVTNPDGKNGINIHIDAGPDTIMNPVTKAIWKKLSESHRLKHQETLGTDYGGTDYDFTAFQTIEKENFSAARQKIFRYCIFAHALGGEVYGRSGWAYAIPGTECIVTLGTFEDGEGTVTQQAGTLMHEFGHCLGLRHGGFENTHYKPNFLSVMNYLFQLKGLRYNSKDGTINYSFKTLPDLDENELDKTVGLNGGADIQDYGTRYYYKDGNKNYQTVVNKANGPIDWDMNGTYTETDTVADLNKDGKLTLLKGYNDWANLAYAAGSIGSRGDKIVVEPIERESESLTHEIDEEIPDPYQVVVGFSSDMSTAAGGTATFTATVRNIGDNFDVYTLTAESDQNWADLSKLPSRLEIAAGGEAQLQIPVVVPATAQAGDIDNIHLVATSTNNPSILDSDDAILTVNRSQSSSSSTAIQGSALDSSSGGCFIATAAYGSYLDPHVVTLRNFRDQVLLTNGAGRAFVRAYYQFSPPAAALIARSTPLRTITVLALTPLVCAIEHPLCAVMMLIVPGILIMRIVHRRRKRIFEK